MSLTLHELNERVRVMQERLKDGVAMGEVDALRSRIDAGYAKIDTAIENGAAEDVILKAKARITDLERELAGKEKAFVIPAYLETVLIQIQRDALKWQSVPKGSVLIVSMPGTYDVMVRLDNLPEEPPF